MEQLTTNFTYEEVTRSDTAERLGIDNNFPTTLLGAIKSTAAGMERVRVTLGALPIHINSWYRCPTLNSTIGSASTSQHLRGEAVDFTCSVFGSPLVICKQLIANSRELNFDQLILEHTWVHISFCANPNAKPRNRVLSLLATGKYAAGLTDTVGNAL